MAVYNYRDRVHYSNFKFVGCKDWHPFTDWESRKDFWLEADQSDEVAFAPWRTTSHTTNLQFQYSED